MITREEYLDALKIAETYRIEQNLEAIQEGDSMTCNEFYIKYKSEMSTRLKNVFYYLLINHLSFTYIGELDADAFGKLRNVGQKSLDEFIKLKEKLG